MRRCLYFVVLAMLFVSVFMLGIYAYRFFYPQRYERTENGEYINIETAAKSQTFPVDEATKFVIEYYYPEEQRLLTEQLDAFPNLLGCDKSGVEQYLQEYMTHLSKKEQEEGLVSFELTGYNQQTITLRKVYQKKGKTGFYAHSFNGTIVILKSDNKTVYEYTKIMIHTLPEEIQNKVKAGYYLENEEALYGFLENYSS